MTSLTKHALSLNRCESFSSALYKVFPNYSTLLFPNCENGVTNELNYLVNANERVQLRSHFSKNERKTTTGTFCILYLLLFFQVVKSYLEVIDEKATVTRLVFFQDYKRQAGPG